MSSWDYTKAVSYTHLDVYKRQDVPHGVGKGVARDICYNCPVLWNMYMYCIFMCVFWGFYMYCTFVCILGGLDIGLIKRKYKT